MLMRMRVGLVPPARRRPLGPRARVASPRWLVERLAHGAAQRRAGANGVSRLAYVAFGGYTNRVAKTRPSDDLFTIFPDLPGVTPRSPEGQIDKVHRQVEETRRRARENILRQQAASARVRAAIAGRVSPRRRR